MAAGFVSYTSLLTDFHISMVIIALSLFMLDGISLLAFVVERNLKASRFVSEAHVGMHADEIAHRHIEQIIHEILLEVSQWSLTQS
jgi:molybdopterin/thiamine biosynthesis adenylyltransferase